MSVTRPRGSLPARVYWTRRVLVLGVAFALVLGIGKLFGAAFGSDQPPGRPATAKPRTSPAAVQTPAVSPAAVSTADARAADAGAADAGAADASADDAPADDAHDATRDQAGVRTPLAAPSGPCQDSDVRVVPARKDEAYAGGNVRLTLELTTPELPACSWEVSPDAVAVKLTSGSDRVWSSQDCPDAVPKEPVVLRDNKPVLVDVVWSGRRSDPDCSRGTRWAEPGYYHLSVAAMGSEPESRQFRLLPPAPVTITPTPTSTPKSKHKPTPDAEAASKPTGKPTPKPTSKPSRHS